MSNKHTMDCKLTTMSFPAFSCLFPSFIAAAAAAPDEIPICKRHSHNQHEK